MQSGWNSPIPIAFCALRKKECLLDVVGWGKMAMLRAGLTTGFVRHLQMLKMAVEAQDCGLWILKMGQIRFHHPTWC